MALVITRRVGQGVYVGEMLIVVREVRGEQVRLEFVGDELVLREELRDQIRPRQEQIGRETAKRIFTPPPSRSHEIAHILPDDEEDQ